MPNIKTEFILSGHKKQNPFLKRGRIITLNLRTKLIGSFVIILILMVGVGLMGTYTSKTIRDRLDNIIEKDVKPANILGDVARRVGFIRANSLLHLLTRSIDDMNRYESEVADLVGKVNTDLDTLKNTFEDQATLDKLAEFRTALETYLRIWREQVLPLSRANRDEEAFAFARKIGAGGMAAREAMYKLDELHDTNVAAANHRLKLAEQDSRKSQSILSAVILLAIILGLAFGIRQGSLVAGPVNIVSKAAQLIAAGDLDQRVIVKTGDEIESMADSFNTMTVKLKTMVEELQREITLRNKSEKEVRKYRDNLEELVKQRTAELITANKQLQGEITERKQAEVEIKQFNIELNRSNEDLEQFAYVASHDLQEPLRMISSYTQLLERRYKDKLDEDANDFINFAVDGANRMQKLINDLLDFSRVKTRGELFKEVDSHAMLGSALSNLRVLIAETNTLVTNDNLPKISADKSQFVRIFQNLIDNAIKFHRKESPRIHVSAQEKEDEWLFSVRDNGIGIDKQFQERIFTIFQTLHGKEEYPGTGIGLAICKRIVQRHGGKIWFESEQGKETTFYFTISKLRRLYERE